MKQTELIFKFLHGDDYCDLFLKIQWIEADLNDTMSMEEALEGIDEIYHCAALVSFKRSDKNALERTNVNATANLVNLAIEKGIKKFGYISSVAALGRNEKGMIDEFMAPEEPEFSSFYSKSKYYAEMEVWRGISEGLNAVIINPGVILGCGDFSLGSLKIFDSVKDGLPYYPPGSNGYVDARDIAKIFVELMQKEDAFGKRYCLVEGSISYKDLFAKIASRLHVKAPVKEAGKSMGYLFYTYSLFSSLLKGEEPSLTLDMVNTAYKKYLYDNSLVKKTLGYEFIPMDKTIDDACKAYNELYPS